MAENAKGSRGTRKKGGFVVRRSSDTGAYTTYLATGLESMPRTRKRPLAQETVTDPNDGSPYLRQLRTLGDKADRGETVDSTGMSDEEFLKAFLGR